MKKIAVLVSNDLSHDQRVRKTCEVLLKHGLEPVLVGRLLEGSIDFERPYETVRFPLKHTGGARFYAELQKVLDRFLRSRGNEFTGVWANDLDTLWPAWRFHKRTGKAIIYDSHEYFTEAAGLTGRPFPKKVWETIEGRIFPRLKYVFTVNESIAEIYRKKYKVDVQVLRNVPFLKTQEIVARSRQELGLPEGRLVILQGAFMDKDRGIVEAVEAFQHLNDVHLLLVGAGEEWQRAQELRKELGLEDKITIKPKLPYKELVQHTRNADLGLSLDKGLHFNYYYSLPNKLFDYIHAGIPVLASPLPEVKRVVEGMKVGQLIPDWDPKNIAEAIEKILSIDKQEWTSGLQEARETFNWDAESQKIKVMLERAELI
ncbi:MAG: glycosyltransferase [Flavobacteriales bacterium]|nr:glycosyltransferase [Flavobacteriales bacterium]